jgi:hypothetical protein
MYQIKMIKKYFVKNPKTKTTYILQSEETEIITQKEYSNIINSAYFFRNLGGKVSQQKKYTCKGYTVVKDTSVSPTKLYKTVRQFEFIYLQN